MCSKQLFANTPMNMSNFHVIVTKTLKGRVTYNNDESGPTTKTINLNTTPIQCSDNCVSQNYFLCAYAIVFMKDCSKEPHTFIQPNYTFAAGLNALNLSLGRIKEK